MASFVTLGGVQFGPGTTPFFSSTLSSAAQNVSTIGCLLVHCIIDNTMNGAVTYVQFFNKPAASVVVGVTPAAFAIPVAASAVSPPISFPIYGVDFSGGLCVAATTTATSSGAPGVPLNIAINILGNICTPITLATDNV